MTRRFWTDAETDLLKNAYPTTPTKQIALVLGRSASSVQQKATSLKLQRSKEFVAALSKAKSDALKKVNNKGRFRKGMKPWNAGISFRTKGSEKTYFKPGQIPLNTRPEGSTRISAGYLLIKRGKQWIPAQRYVWELHHGPVPKNHVVAFKDRKAVFELHQIKLVNLELLSRKELMKQNSGQNTPLWKLYQLKGAINRKVNKIVKEHNARKSAH